MRSKTFSIITFGCRVNQAESRMLGERLASAAMKQCSNETIADIVIINTCAVTAKAEKEVRQMIRRVKRENLECFLVATGCWATKIKNERQKIKNTNEKLLKLIDLVVGNEDKLRIPEILLGRKARPFQIRKDGPFKSFYRDKYFKHKKALIKIQDGCDNFCTYCIVPYLRGRSVSRPVDEIVEEVGEKVEQGIKEIVLTGIDIASYKFKLKTQNSKPHVKT